MCVLFGLCLAKIRHCYASGCLAAVSSSAYRIPGNEMWTQWEGEGRRQTPGELSADETSLELKVPFVHVGREDADLIRQALTEREIYLNSLRDDDDLKGIGSSTIGTSVDGSVSAGEAGSDKSSLSPPAALLNSSLLSDVNNFHVFLSSDDSPNPWQSAYTSLYFTIFYQAMLGCLHVLVCLVAAAKFKRYWALRQVRPFYSHVPLVCLGLVCLSNLERALYCSIDPMGATHTVPRAYRRVLLSASVPWTYATTLLLTLFWWEAITGREQNGNVDKSKASTDGKQLHMASEDRRTNRLSPFPHRHSPAFNKHVELEMAVLRAPSPSQGGLQSMGEQRSSPMEEPTTPHTPFTLLSMRNAMTPHTPHMVAGSSKPTSPLRSSPATSVAVQHSPAALAKQNLNARSYVGGQGEFDEPLHVRGAEDSSDEDEISQLGDDAGEDRQIERDPPSFVHTLSAERRGAKESDPVVQSSPLSSPQPVHTHLRAPLPHSHAHASLRIAVPMVLPRSGRANFSTQLPPPPPTPPMIPAPPTAPLAGVPSTHKQHLASATMPRSASYAAGMHSKPVYLHLTGDSSPAMRIPDDSRRLSVDGVDCCDVELAGFTAIPASPGINSADVQHRHKGSSSFSLPSPVGVSTSHVGMGLLQQYRFLPVSRNMQSNMPTKRVETQTPSVADALAPLTMIDAKTPKLQPPQHPDSFLRRYRTAFIVATVALCSLDLLFSLLDAMYVLNFELLPTVESVFAFIGIIVTGLYVWVSVKVIRRLQRLAAEKEESAVHNFALHNKSSDAVAVGQEIRVESPVALEDDWMGRAGLHPLHMQHYSAALGISPLPWLGMRNAHSSPALATLAMQQHGALPPVAPLGSAPSSPHLHAPTSPQLLPYFNYPRLSTSVHRGSPAPPPICAPNFAAVALAAQQAVTLAQLRAASREKIVRMLQFLVGNCIGLLLFLAVTLTSPQMWHTRTQTTLDDPFTSICRDFLAFFALFIVGACQVLAF
jgi:hypothetical protein